MKTALNTISKQGLRVIISGGGTGGHIFPAISIANALKKLEPTCEILFVGAANKMEMEKVPAAGYKIVGLPVTGLKRSLSLSNLKLPFMLCKSIKMASNIIKEFKPNAAIGVGGYASAPLLKAASNKKVPYIIQEQNSYAGVTNKLLAKKAAKICVAYPNMEKFFPKEKILITGNPVREGIEPATELQKEEARNFFGFKKSDKIILVVGGSLGAGTLNSSVKKWASQNLESDVSIIWQCGKYYFNEIDNFNKANPRSYIRCFEFIKEMDKAFAAANIVISRAGAGTISELCIAGKATIFVPSPNVAEDHQRHNAMALSTKGAAVMVHDNLAYSKLMESAIELVNDSQKIEELEIAIAKMALHNSDEIIANEVIKLCNTSKNSKK